MRATLPRCPFLTDVRHGLLRRKMRLADGPCSPLEVFETPPAFPYGTRSRGSRPLVGARGNRRHFPAPRDGYLASARNFLQKRSHRSPGISRHSVFLICLVSGVRDGNPGRPRHELPRWGRSAAAATNGAAAWQHWPARAGSPRENSSQAFHLVDFTGFFRANFCPPGPCSQTRRLHACTRIAFEASYLFAVCARRGVRRMCGIEQFHPAPGSSKLEKGNIALCCCFGKGLLCLCKGVLRL